MYDQSKLSELIRFARVDAGSTVIDVYPGDGAWTRLFSDIVGPEGRVFSFVPTEVAHFKDDPLGRMQALAKEPGRENVEAVSADLVAMPEATQPADVLWLHLFYHDLHTALIRKKGATAADFNRAVYERLKPGGRTTPPPQRRARATPSRCIGSTLHTSARRWRRRASCWICHVPWALAKTERLTAPGLIRKRRTRRDRRRVSCPDAVGRPMSDAPGLQSPRTRQFR
jgi:hypothetical protein